MKSIIVLAALGFVIAAPVHADDSGLSLEDQLKSLEIPADRSPVHMSAEKLYSVQDRYLGLGSISELSVSGGKNFTGDSFLTSQELGLSYRYHFNDRWSLGVGGYYGFNELSSGAKRLLGEKEGYIPDVDFVKGKAELSVARNMLYGKLRLGMDRVIYFDQYLALGAGVASLSSGMQPTGILEGGMVFWLGRGGSVRLGIKDSIYSEKRVLSSGIAHNLIGQVSVGMLFGGERSI